MKKSPFIIVMLTALAVVAPLSALAQVSISRVGRSLDKATGGATTTTAPATTKPGQTTTTATAPVPTVSLDPQAIAQAQKERQAQIAAAAAAANKRNKAALVGADQRVIDFLKKRIADGSADAALDLAKRHEEGKGVPEDPIESRRLYALAAERGNEEAKTWLEEHPAPKAPPVDAKKEVAAPKKPEFESKPIAPVVKKNDVAPKKSEP